MTNIDILKKSYCPTKNNGFAFPNFYFSKMDGRHLTLTILGRYLIQFNLLIIYKCLVVLNYTTIQINDVMSELQQVSRKFQSLFLF